MTQDLYEILEIPENANDLWINRAYARKRAAIADDSAISETERQSRLDIAERAFAILSNPNARAQYDSQRLVVPEAVEAPARKTGLTPARTAIWGGVVVLFAVAGGLLWQHSRAEERLRIEQERAAAEVAARVREMEAGDRAKREAIKKMGAAVEQQQAKQQFVDQERAARPSEKTNASDDQEIQTEQAAIAAERKRVEAERRRR